ncbi:MAG: CPBP family intramembrane glutamic endopeptidase [Armatimonadota bacterium]|nr:CPBP family intramembrane metalloprotease [bacterium]
MGKGKSKFTTVITLIVGAAIVGGLWKFNQCAISYNQYLVGNLIALFWLPMLTIMFMFREEPEKFGFCLGSWKRIWAVLLVCMACLVPIMLYAARLPAYQAYYPLFRHYPEFWNVFNTYPQNSPWTSAPMQMLYAEVSYGMYMFCWEFFFRGYLLLGLMRSMGWWAVIIQALAFGLLHFGKPTTEVIASFGAGVILGIIALNAKSFVPGFVLHWLASMTFDMLVVASRPHH